jgi:Mn2+/Fe2+ NRAMP family transporter
MSTQVALFLFVAAAVVAVFAFLSVAAWVGTRAQERKARDRYALLKTLAEQPGEAAQRVLDLLREQEERQAERREREERRGYLVGGLVTFAVGIAVAVMLETIGTKAGIWTVGLIPLLIGVVLTGFGLFARPAGRSTSGQEQPHR